MKKIITVSVLSFLLIGEAQAHKNQAFEKALDIWEQSYPILNQVRRDPEFIQACGIVHRKFYNSENNQNFTVEQILDETIKRVINGYIKAGLYDFVEGLDPVVRDLRGLEPLTSRLPTLYENPYEVKRIFPRSH